MSNSIQHRKLVELVRKIINVEGTEKEVDLWIDEFKKSVPHPMASDLIFWPQNYGLGLGPTPEEIVEKALSYKPIDL